MEKGFKGLFVLVTWTSSVFRAYPSKWRAIHLEAWQTLQKAPVEVKIAALQIINLNLPYSSAESTWAASTGPIGLGRDVFYSYVCLASGGCVTTSENTTSSDLDSLLSAESGRRVLTAREFVSFCIQPGQVRRRPPLDRLTKLLS